MQRAAHQQNSTVPWFISPLHNPSPRWSQTAGRVVSAGTTTLAPFHFSPLKGDEPSGDGTSTSSSLSLSLSPVLIADDCKTSRATAMGTQASENHVPAKVCVHHLIEISFFRPWRHLLCSSPSIVRIIFSNA